MRAVNLVGAISTKRIDRKLSGGVRCSVYCLASIVDAPPAYATLRVYVQR